MTYQRQSSLNGEASSGQNPAVAMTRPTEAAADESWEASHKKEVADLLDKAEASAEGEKTAAFAKYTELFKYVGQHLSEIKDENLKQRLAKASDVRTHLASAIQVAATENSAPSQADSSTTPARPASRRWRLQSIAPTS